MKLLLSGILEFDLSFVLLIIVCLFKILAVIVVVAVSRESVSQTQIIFATAEAEVPGNTSSNQKYTYNIDYCNNSF